MSIMEKIKGILNGFKEKLISLGFDEQQMSTIMYEIILVASAKLSEEDLTFLTPEELEFVSNKDLLQLTPEQMQEITQKSPNLMKYLDVYGKKLDEAIGEFDQVVADVREESEKSKEEGQTSTSA